MNYRDDNYYAHTNNLTGEPSEKNRVYRATADSWTRGMRGKTFGVAQRGAAAHTYKSIAADGTVTIKSVQRASKTTAKRKVRVIADKSQNQRNRELSMSLHSKWV